jgi:Flp pilus assembly protein TadG
MRGKGQQGASAVEFALVLPLLVLLLFGMITFGLAFARMQQMEAVAREGARLAAIGRTVTYTDVQSAARGTVDGRLIAREHIQVQINGSTAASKWCKEPGQSVQVTVSIAEAYRPRYALIVPLWRASLTPPRYEATGVFRCESKHT